MQSDQLWSKTYALFSSQISVEVAETWLSQLSPVSFEQSQLTLVGSARARSWVELRYGRPLAQCASQAAGVDVRITLVSPDAVTIDSGMESTAIDPSSTGALPSTALNPKYTFSQFVIGKSNHIAHAAALAVAEQPAQAFNPLFIYGAPGVGKTHLLHSIGNYLADQAPEMTARYLTAENFASLFRTVIRDGTIGRFKTDLRNSDVLLVDDVQFLQSKVKTEEEFFHTFNALHEAGRQLVISCDRTPRQLEQLADRLRERFESGLVVEVEAPDHRLRSAILGKRVQVDNIPIDDGLALDRIAARVPANVRSLEGALIRVSAFASMRDQPVNTELVDELLDAIHPDSNPRSALTHLSESSRVPPAADAAQIISVVAEHFGLSVDELVGSGRTRAVTGPRQIAMYLACQLTDETLPQIAKRFGRDHSTVVHARNKVAQQIRSDASTAPVVDSLKARVISSPVSHEEPVDIVNASLMSNERSTTQPKPSTAN